MKLLRIVVNNLNLCDKDLTISFVPTANKTEEDKEFELSEIADNLYTFNTVGIVGKNASGKTTMINILAIVYDIISFYRIKNTTNLLNLWKDKINLDITFYHEGMLYHYLTNLVGNENSVENTILFENQKIYCKEYHKSYAKNIFDYTDYKELPITSNLPKDTSILYEILKDLEIRGIPLPNTENNYRNFQSSFAIYKLIDKDYKILEKVIKMFDNHIEKIVMIEPNKFKVYYTNKKIIQVNNMTLGEILSSGTNKGIELFSLVIYSLKTGTDLALDEIENHFHKTLVENLINLYKDKSVNKKGATLVFTTHYCELLDLFNRSDNIYITKYNQKIKIENMHQKYKLRPELLKSKKFYENAFGTGVDYEALMNFKKELM